MDEHVGEVAPDLIAPLRVEDQRPDVGRAVGANSVLDDGERTRTRGKPVLDEGTIIFFWLLISYNLGTSYQS